MPSRDTGGPQPSLHPRPRRRWLFLGALVVLGAAAGAIGFLRGRSAAPREDVFTLYVLGSSTALGYPYFPHAGAAEIARLFTGGTVEGRPLRVVNLAGPGKTARVVVKDVESLLRRAPPAGTAAAFVLVGNNEFLNYDRRHDLRRAERALFDTPAVSPLERQAVVGRYEAQLERALVLLRDAGIRPIVSTVAVDLKDWEPNRSVLADSTHAAALRDLFARAQRSLDGGEIAAALVSYEEALRLEPDFAWAAKRAGDCALRLGRTERARRHFQRAVDGDGNPLRDTSAMTAAVHRLAARNRTPVVDAVALLNAASPDSVLGHELLWDNCHPNLEGYTLLGRALATVLDSLFDVAWREVTPDQIRTELGIDAAVEQDVLHREGQYVYGASTLVFDPGPRLRRARGYLERADAIGPSAEVQSSLAVLAALEGRVEDSLGHWRTARGLDAEVARRRIENRSVREIMARHGVHDLAGAIEPASD